MDELAELIRTEIAASPQKAITFERFMDLALYHPTLGYYRRQKTRTGREGDFITSVSVGPMFGRLILKQLEECWNKLKKPEKFTVFEQGAEDRQLAADITFWCREQAPEFFAALRYEFIEDKPQPQTHGAFLSNELVDAFPVRRVKFESSKWHELGVGMDGEWRAIAIEDEDLVEALQHLPKIEGYTTEINLRARRWMEQTSRMLEQGYFLTIDYGFPASVYYAPFRVNGTLTAYRNHQRTNEVLRDPGQQDITAHVDFTALARGGERAGLETLGFVDQQRFLMGIAEEELAGTASLSVGIAENLKAWQMLTHPNHFGSRFQVLVQGKNAPGGLAGLRFARPGGLD